MYSINGVPLDEGVSGGWRILRTGTSTQGGITNSLNTVPVPGRPGYRPAPHTFAEQIVVFNVHTPRDRLEELLALCAAATTLSLTGDSSKEARVELASAIPDSVMPCDDTFKVTVTLSIFEGVWRDVTAVVEGPESITSPTQTFTMLPDLSAPIYDMDIFIRGVFGEFVLTDSGGSSLRTIRAWPGSAGTGLLYVGSTQQAFFSNNSNPWVPVSDASQYVSVSGNGGLRLTPKLVSGNPADREVEISLTTLSQTSTTLTVRAKRAYRMN